MDRQQADCMYDIYGNEIYEGDAYYDIDGTIVADIERGENYVEDNNVIAALVEKLGTREILARLGYIIEVRA